MTEIERSLAPSEEARRRAAPLDDAPQPDNDGFRMTPLLWVLGVLALLVGTGAGLVLSAVSLGR